MRKFFVLAMVMFTAFSFTACNKGTGVDKASLVARTWYVVDARFGTEKPSEGLFDGFMMSFTADGKYQVANPNAVPASPTRTTSNTGTWTLNTGGTAITFDANSAQENRVNIVSLSGNRMEIEWREEKPGKVATTYAFVLQAK
jgi:hypothetical protein